MSGEITSYIPQGLAEIKEFCSMVSKSNIVPKEYIGKPENVFVACMKGMDLGLKPLQALECIAVINGKTSLYGDAYLAIARGSGKVETYKEEVVGEGVNMKAIVHVKRRGEDVITSEYSAKDAQTAGLWGKQGPWSQHPKRMLTMKARNYCLRAAFADLFLGLEYSAEELIEVAESKSQKDVTQAAPVKNTGWDENAETQPTIIDQPQSGSFCVDGETLKAEGMFSLIMRKIQSLETKEDVLNYENWRMDNDLEVKRYAKDYLSDAKSLGSEYAQQKERIFSQE